ncbi:hypothetical protein AYL99_00912 [Fonsecaea erecta]|uniref:Methyltransferase domain-containing protein n=1 Tax=Fonsecaea erecta TaxID=1367422 RepID=A0A178ZYK1_9EURO|nr:hypothetical protein AYL99_00912 [Fonsecaea erecta]OAP64940.1 hypothetical protein AYL99_00912 [Fonsecaea erecta]
MQEADEEQQVDQVLEADDDQDSAVDLGEDQISTTSITSTIRNYHIENGRTYHALSAGKYILPNDEVICLSFCYVRLLKSHPAARKRAARQWQQTSKTNTFWRHSTTVPTLHREQTQPNECSMSEQERASGQCNMLIITLRLRYHSPGKLARQCRYVLTVIILEVIGVDLSPIQPENVAPNCSFEIDDVEQEWTWSFPFDYIFSRMMVGSFADWPSFISRAYENLTPGGWLELQDCIFPLATDDGTFHKGQTIWEWGNLLLEASEKLGRSLGAATQHREHMIAAGFTNVSVKHFKWPTNSWPKDPKHKLVGLWTLANIGQGLDGLSMALLSRGHGWTREQVLAYLPAVRKDLRNSAIHAYWPIMMAITKAASPTIAALDQLTKLDLDHDHNHDHGLESSSTTPMESTMTIMDATPPTTISALSDKGDDDDDDYTLSSPPRPRFLCPWPGSLYMIQSSWGKILTLHGGEVILSEPDDRGIGAVGGSVHWACEENKGWLGFRNVASGKYLGYDGKGNRHGRLVCVSPHHRGWENFVVRPRPDGGYLLFTTHYDQLWRVGTRLVEKQQQVQGKERGAEAILAKIDGEDALGEEIVWEFIKV